LEPELASRGGLRRSPIVAAMRANTVVHLTLAFWAVGHGAHSNSTRG
jgi:hypothetical protein